MIPKIRYARTNVIWASMPGNPFPVAEIYLGDSELFGVVYFDETKGHVFLECWGNGVRDTSVAVDLKELQTLLSNLENELIQTVRNQPPAP